MRLEWTSSAWNDYVWWQDHDRKIVKRINLLIKDVMREPSDGIGKPELLKANLSGCWSRRITDEHRLVYSATEKAVVIISCRYHYE